MRIAALREEKVTTKNTQNNVTFVTFLLQLVDKQSRVFWAYCYFFYRIQYFDSEVKCK